MSLHTQKIELAAQIRTTMGGKVSALRRTGLVPAVLYGKDQEPISLQVPVKEFSKTLKEAGESTLVYVNVDGQSYPTIIHDVARHPHSNEVIHADFYKVNLKEKIKTMVPVVFTGEAPAVKDLKGIFVRNVNEIEVEALPTDLPHEISIDISGLAAFGDQIVLKDINLAKGVTVTGEPETIVATVQEPISEDELKKELESTSSIDDVKIVEKEKKEEIVDDETPAESPKAE
jgi:large subunit ribosomal protein L25